MITNPDPQAAAAALRSQLNLQTEADLERLTDAFVTWAEVEVRPTKRAKHTAFSAWEPESTPERLIIFMPEGWDDQARRVTVVSIGSQATYLTKAQIREDCVAAMEWGQAFAAAFLSADPDGPEC